jgi:5-methyltetrahydrofolate--homocysteine methyltransferase
MLRAVGVATTLLSKEMRGNFIAEHRAEYAKIRERLANKQPKAAKLSYAESIENGFKVDDNYVPPIPNTLGTQVITNYPLQHWLNILTGHHSLSLGAWRVNSRKS